MSRIDQPIAEIKPNPKSKTVPLIIFVVVACCLVATIFFLPVKSYVIEALEWIAGLGYWGPFAVIIFYIVACVFFLPGSVITLGAGFIFGLHLGFITAWSGACLGACTAFLVSRTFGRDWVQSKIVGSPKFSAVNRAVAGEGFKVVLLLRLSPVVPFNFLNYALGLTGVPFWKYALASALGMIPGGLMYVYFGSAARSLTDIAAGNIQSGSLGQLFFWIGLFATILVTVLITRAAKKQLEKTAQT
jgi:uncharacterized membrane protein YdjX (TVP38/TMEM64 family)